MPRLQLDLSRLGRVDAALCQEIPMKTSQMYLQFSSCFSTCFSTLIFETRWPFQPMEKCMVRAYTLKVMLKGALYITVRQCSKSASPTRRRLLLFRLPTYLLVGTLSLGSHKQCTLSSPLSPHEGLVKCTGIWITHHAYTRTGFKCWLWAERIFGKKRAVI